jgi:hypothetical protein
LPISIQKKPEKGGTVSEEKNSTKSGNGSHPPEERLRPGISNESLRRHNIRHAGKEESSELIGYPAPGIIIPYTTTDGESLKVNGRHFHRIRLDDPTSAKYLSPKGSGAQLFIPQDQIFGAELVIAESEFKAAALAEAGIPTVGIGGICSAMTDGKMIPELKTFMTKHPPTTVYFLGDADTCFLSAFSIEAIKLAKALPGGCQLKLPRIPATMPNGIDDCREKLGDGFNTFWQEIKKSALLIDPDLPPATLAIRLAIRELPSIAGLTDREIQIRRLANLASHLSAIELETLAREVNKIFKITLTAFRQSAKQIRTRRLKEETEQAQRDPQKLIPQALLNDPRPKLELPGSRDRLSSEFASELGPILAKQKFYTKDKVVVVPDIENAKLIMMLPAAFRTELEKYVIPFKVVKNQAGYLSAFNRSLTKDDADTTLQSSHLTSHLSKIRAVNNIQLPKLRASGQIELLPEGYDQESMIYTMPGSPGIMDMDVETARETLSELFEEFCFVPGDERRAKAVTIAAMLTLFCFNILPQGTLRPAFIYSANAEGSGKTLLAKIAVITRLGYASASPWPETDEEVAKQTFANALEGSSILFFDNAKRGIGGAAIESAISTTTITGRVLGFSKEMELENMMTLFITANGAEISPDMRRRSLQVDLLLKEARSEDRVIKYPLNDVKLIELRPAILGMLWSITRHWAISGQPKSEKTLSSFEPWSEIIGGILECNGFGSPCEPNPSRVSGDIYTTHMIALVSEMELNRKYDFTSLVNLARQHELFDKLVGEVSDTELEPSERKSFSSILKRFNNRKFSTGRWFHRWQKSKNNVVYYTDLNQPET